MGLMVNPLTIFPGGGGNNLNSPLPLLLTYDLCYMFQMAVPAVMCVFYLHSISALSSVLLPFQTFRIKPPMCITMDDADFFVAVFNKAIHNCMERRVK